MLAAGIYSTDRSAQNISCTNENKVRGLKMSNKNAERQKIEELRAGQSLIAEKFRHKGSEFTLPVPAQYWTVEGILTNFGRKKIPDVIESTTRVLCDGMSVNHIEARIQPATNLQVRRVGEIYTDLLSVSAYFLGEAPANDLVYHIMLDLCEIRELSHENPNSKILKGFLSGQRQVSLSQELGVPSGNLSRSYKKYKTVVEKARDFLITLELP